MRILPILIVILTVVFSVVTVAEEKIDLNSATAEEIATLNNIGLKKAEKIVEYRQSHGQFESVDDLKNVKGIGSVTIEKNRDRMVAVQN